MQVVTSRFGEIEIADDEVITFPDGLPGFAGRRSMVLVGGGNLPGSETAPEAEYDTLYWIQDTVDPDLAFLSLVPWEIYPDYDIDIDPSDVDGADPDDLCVLSIVTVRRENEAVHMTSNLLAPVVINTRTRTGRQVILDDSRWPVHAPLVDSTTPAPSTGTGT